MAAHDREIKHYYEKLLTSLGGAEAAIATEPQDENSGRIKNALSRIRSLLEQCEKVPLDQLLPFLGEIEALIWDDLLQDRRLIIPLYSTVAASAWRIVSGKGLEGNKKSVAEHLQDLTRELSILREDVLGVRADILRNNDPRAGANYARVGEILSEAKTLWSCFAILAADAKQRSNEESFDADVSQWAHTVERSFELTGRALEISGVPRMQYLDEVIDNIETLQKSGSYLLSEQVREVSDEVRSYGFMPLSELLQQCLRAATYYRKLQPPSALEPSLNDFEQLIDEPEQKLAPFQFAISGSRLTLLEQVNHPKPGASVHLPAALNAILAMAEDVLVDLERSNHERLLRSFGRLNDALRKRTNAVEVGLLATAFEKLVGGSSEELSDSLAASLIAFSRSALSYAAQFEDWQEFSDNAAEIEITPKQDQAFVQLATVLATELERRQEVDKRVPEALTTAAKWSDNGGSPRSRLGVSRTVLNVIAICFSALVIGPSQAVLAVGTDSVTAIVLSQALPYADIISQSPEGAWLQPAVKVIAKKLDELEKLP